MLGILLAAAVMLQGGYVFAAKGSGDLQTSFFSGAGVYRVDLLVSAVDGCRMRYRIGHARDQVRVQSNVTRWKWQFVHLRRGTHRVVVSGNCDWRIEVYVPSPLG